MISYAEPFCAHKIITYTGTSRTTVAATCQNCGTKYYFKRVAKDARTPSLCLKCR